MSINFRDIKYFIIFSLVQYSTAVVLKSPKYYTSIYIKKQSKTTFYIHNPYKARKNNDYNYKDWEETKQDVYDYLLPSANQTSTTASNITNETRPKELFSPGTLFTPTNPILESSQYHTSNSSSATYPTLPSTDSTPDTSLPTPSIVSTPLSISPSLSIPYNTTTTTLTQKVSTKNITVVTTTPSTTVIIKDLRGQYIRNEIKEAKEKLGAGLFTASIHVIFKIIAKKAATHVKSLLNGLQTEFARLNTHHHLAMFGPTVNSVFTFVVSSMASAPVNFIQTQAKNGQEVIEHRKYLLEFDTRAIFDVVDAIYIEDDYNRIVDSLIDIQNFPNVSNNDIEIAEKAIEAFFLQPYHRIKGTAKEKLLMMEIHNAVEKIMAVNEKKTIKNQKQKFRKYGEITTERTASSVDITKFKAKKVTEEIYKAKIRDLRWKKGPTSTTTTTTRSTMMPKMHKSKYYIRKYIIKDLYEMKKSTPRTTKFYWRFTGKLKTKNI